MLQLPSSLSLPGHTDDTCNPHVCISLPAHRPRVRRSPTRRPPANPVYIEPAERPPSTRNPDAFCPRTSVCPARAQGGSRRDITVGTQRTITPSKCSNSSSGTAQTLAQSRGPTMSPPPPQALSEDPYGVREAASRGHEPDRKRHRAAIRSVDCIRPIQPPSSRPPAVLPPAASRPWNARQHTPRAPSLAHSNSTDHRASCARTHTFRAAASHCCRWRRKRATSSAWPSGRSVPVALCPSR
ncbi:hypothetical protein C8Q73DRAFT_539145 [Cubamyces lactineus]|nr:hypothetical protein C8Q73DRAFT_539145 [Cubamyces lactineus]